MSSEAAIGAGIHVGELELGALLELSASIGQISERLARLLEAQDRYEKEGPVFVQVLGGGNVDASQDPVYIDLGGPAYGRVWEVRQLIVGGLTWATTVAGSASIIVGPTAPSAITGVGLANQQDDYTTLPHVGFYSAGQFRVRHPNHVFVAILLGTASTPYVVGGDAYDSPDKGIRSVFQA